MESTHSTRRQFLKTATGIVAGLAGLPAGWSVFARADDKVRRSRVALLTNPRVLVDVGVRKIALKEMLEDGLCISLNKKTAKEAWHSILTENDKILLKFNRADADRIATSEPMAIVLIQSLMDAGIEPRQIMLLEAVIHDGVNDLAEPEWGWSERSYMFASGSEQIVKAAERATAIINVPFLKAHRIAGMTCCLKNLSHGLIRRPALYHANQCCPYIPDIVAMPVIRNKLKLNIVNAIRLVYDTRPDVIRDPLDTASTLVMGTDPVATDTIAQGVLDSVRQEHSLKAVAQELGLVQQHRLATEKGLGINNPEYIDVVRSSAV